MGNVGYVAYALVGKTVGKVKIVEPECYRCCEFRWGHQQASPSRLTVTDFPFKCAVITVLTVLNVWPVLVPDDGGEALRRSAR